MVMMSGCARAAEISEFVRIVAHRVISTVASASSGGADKTASFDGRTIARLGMLAAATVVSVTIAVGTER